MGYNLCFCYSTYRSTKLISVGYSQLISTTVLDLFVPGMYALAI